MAEMTTTIYDLTVIGAGPGGYEAALEAAKLGLRTALIEKDSLGGTCLNRGCIPTKTLLHSSELYTKICDAERFGISAEHVLPDLSKIQTHKQTTITTLQKGIAALLKAAKAQMLPAMKGSSRYRSHPMEQILLSSRLARSCWHPAVFLLFRRFPDMICPV